MIPEIFLALHDRVAGHARWWPERTALVHGERTLTWAEVAERAERVAAGLRAAGIGRSDPVGILLGNGVEYAEVVTAISRLGAVCVPLSGLLTPELVSGLAEHAGIRFLINDARLRDLTAGLELPQVVVGADYEAWLSAHEPDPTPSGLDPDDLFTVLYSSGTTGTPKGIEHSYAARARIASYSAQNLGIDRRSVTLIATAMYTNGTWMTLLPTLTMGGTTVVMERFDPGEFISLVERYAVTTTFLVPTMLAQILDHPDYAASRLAALDTIFCSGSPLPAAMRRRVLAETALEVVEAYGLTEGFSTMVRLRETPEDRFGTVGKPSPGADLVIVGPDGDELPAGRVGEIAGRSDTLMRGYHRDPEATAAALWHAPDGRVFLRTGDLGRLDEDGWLYLRGRTKDLIISGGLNVFAVDLEEALRAVEGVRDAAVVGIPDPRWGETPLVVVEPAPGTELDPEAIRAAANGRVAKHQRISVVQIRRRLPRNALGKVLKNVLAAEYLSTQEGG